jgi:para-nitrobenzyl esterase
MFQSNKASITLKLNKMNFRRKSLLLLLPGIILVTACQDPVAVTNADPYATPGSHPMIADPGSARTSTVSGDVIGYVHKGVYHFKGIPYAKAERFMPPAKPDPWEGVRSSRSYGPVCPIDVSSMILWDEMEFAQQHNFWYMNEENCLNLNVWSPGISDGKKRPVMVWLHGGGYTAGSSCELPTYDGESLSGGEDVVVVSINHRLNVLGFLDLSAVDEKYAQSANVGMMDIVAALEWVRDNIENFGGDPGNVTIFGQSGGAGKVGTLMYAPSAKGLFHKAIMESGGKPSFRDPEQTRKVGLALMNVLGLSNSEVEKLKEVPHDELLAAGNKAFDIVMGEAQGLRLGWAPVLDGEFLPYQTGDPQGDALSREIPLMIGTTRTEFAGSSRTPLFHGTREEIIGQLRETYADRTDAFVAAFDKAYPTTKMPSDMLDIDFMFRPASMDFANIKSSVEGGAPAYMYLFTWDSPVLDGMLKSAHCMEIAFVFNNIHRNEQYNGGTPEAYALAEKMSRTWASFARSGDPNNELIPQWDPYTEESGVTMLFDNVIESRSHHDKELLEMAAAPSLF